MTARKIKAVLILGRLQRNIVAARAAWQFSFVLYFTSWDKELSKPARVLVRFSAMSLTLEIGPTV
jgi:hypothetical protein